MARIDFVRESGGYGWRADGLEDELIAVRTLLREALKENARLKDEVERLRRTDGGTARELPQVPRIPRRTAYS